jgi:acetyl esterase/lipase
MHGGPGSFGGPGGPGGPKKKGPPPPKPEKDEILDLSLAAGWVLVRPGNRGRGMKAEDGTWLGKAPGTIVDYKAVVRYLRHNDDLIPGNKEHIVSHGLSAGGAMSALLGTSGNSPLYDSYLKECGAADARDDIFISADFCPMCDLEHADAAYEWMYGPFENRDGALYDQEESKALAANHAAYQDSLGYTRKDTGEPLTAENYMEYLAVQYLIPSAEEYLKKLTAEEREAYVQEHPWMNWDGNHCHFTVNDLHQYTGRLKGLPAFDGADLHGECEVFGRADQEGVHFTEYAAQKAGGSVDAYVAEQLKLMNPMTFINEDNPGCAKHFWIRLGTEDNGMSFSVAGNLAAGLEKNGKDVSLKFYWGAGHYEDQDPEDFVEWVNALTK